MRDQQRETSYIAASQTLTFDGVERAVQLASRLRGRWGRGEQANVAAVLEQHPGLKQYRSIVLDLAMVEYRQCLERGELLDAEEFSRRFPTFQRSLYLLIEVQKLVSQIPGLDALDENAQWPQPGEEFLGFSLIAELGHGALARVFLARQPALGNRLVALKVAFHGKMEAEMLGKLQHPNIVPVYSVQEDPDTGFTAVCMPYLGRATLCDILDQAFADARPPRRGRVIAEAVCELSADPAPLRLAAFERILRCGSYVDAVVHLAVQLAEALAYTHSRGICHRDLKPSNVLMSLEGRPLLLDFNLSFDEEVNTGRIGGTLPYMAPEQLQLVVVEQASGRGRADPRSDLFPLGIILYELLCGVHPFWPIPWDLPIDQIAQHLIERQKRGPEPLQKKNPQIDKRLARCVESCLAFEADSRPETAAVLAQSLRRQLRPLPRAKRWVRSHQLASAAAAAVMVVALIGAGVAASRDPYPVRLAKLGRQYAEQGQYDMALECFNESHRLKPDVPDVLRARTLVQIQRGKYQEAKLDLRRLDELDPSAETKACLGYCYSRLGDPIAEQTNYLAAMDMGFRTPAVLNNLGVSYSQSGRLEDSVPLLAAAAAANENLQAPRLNLARVYAALALKRSGPGKAVKLDPKALSCVERAIEIGPPSAEIFYSAATLYVLASEEDSALTPRALEYLRKSVEYGYEARLIRENLFFKPLHSEPGFQKVLSQPVRKDPRVRGDRFVDPLS